jgi:hypothetical protein
VRSVPRASPRPRGLRPWQDKEDYCKPVFAGHDFAKESEKTRRADVIFLIHNDHATDFRLQGSRAGLINKRWDNSTS